MFMYAYIYIHIHTYKKHRYTNILFLILTYNVNRQLMLLSSYTYDARRSFQRWLNSALLSSTFESIHNRDQKKKKGAYRRTRRRDPVAQNRQDKASVHRWQSERLQENSCALHQLWEAKKA